MRPRLAVLHPAIRGAGRPASGRRGPPVFLVRRGRDYFGVIQSLSRTAVQMLSNVDAVHGPYEHGHARLVQLLPPTEFGSRAQGVGWSGAPRPGWWCWANSSRLAQSVGAHLSPTAHCPSPGVEARPYALSMMAAVWLRQYCSFMPYAVTTLGFGCCMGLSWRHRFCSTYISR